MPGIASNGLWRDPQALDAILELHAVANPRIIDLTYNIGTIWGRLPIRSRVVKCDAEPYPELDHQVAWQNAATLFKPAAFDVVVIDPIHVDDAGDGHHARYKSQQYPVAGGECPVADQFPSMFDATETLLKPRTGILLVKMADGIHGNHNHPHGYLLIQHALSRGTVDPAGHTWTYCQTVPVLNQVGKKKPQAGTVTQRHLLNQLADWYVFRLDGSCVGPGRRLRYEKRCVVDGQRFTSRRADAKVCGNACQKKLASR